jgi:hypothetical protein
LAGPAACRSTGPSGSSTLWLSNAVDRFPNDPRRQPTEGHSIGRVDGAPAVPPSGPAWGGAVAGPPAFP